MCVAALTNNAQLNPHQKSSVFYAQAKTTLKRFRKKKSQPRFLAILRMTIKVYTMYFVIHPGLFGMYHFLSFTQFLEKLFLHSLQRNETYLELILDN